MGRLVFDQRMGLMEVEITAIAQLVERTAFNRVVKGSSPFGGIDEDKINPTATTIFSSWSRVRVPSGGDLLLERRQR